MNVPIKTLDGTPVPEYETPGAVAFDLRARKITVIKAKELGLVPTGVIIKTPPGYALMVYPRSSTPKKKGLLIPHGAGIIDQDYCGENDEVLLQFYNFTEEDVTVEQGERIGQGTFVKIERADFIPYNPESTSRGGFGSTGTR